MFNHLVHWLFDPSGLSQHGFCLAWEPSLIWTHALSDLFIGLAYFAITAGMAVMAKRRADLGSRVVFWLFALFIVLCGVGHWLDVLTLWVPAYGIQGAEKAATAMASMTTCIVLWMSLPKIASLPSADQLRESEMRFRGSFAAAHHGMAIVAIDGQILEVNKALTAMLGYTEAELLATTFGAIAHPSELPVDYSNMNALLANRITSYQTERCYLHKDGSPVFAVLAVSLVRGWNDVPRYFVAQMQDITPQKRAEEARRRSDEQFRLLVDSVKDYALYLLDPEGRVASWNAGAERITQYRRDEIIGEYFGRFFTEEDRAESMPERMLEAARQTGRFQGEVWRVRRDGSRYIAEAVLECVRDEAGEIVMYAAITHDTTERREAERTLEEARDRAEQANRAKSNFLAMMSHEIRTPLNGVIGMNALLCKTELTAHQRRLARSVGNCAETLVSTIDDILDVSKLEAERLHLEDVAFDMRRLIDSVIDLMRARAEQAGLRLSARLTGLPYQRFYGDPTRLRQVVLNLVANAIKFTERGFVKVVVMGITHEDGSNNIRIEVQDSGIGIADDAKLRLFRPFEQADDTITRRFGGTGLGLTICKNLIELMGGEIGVTDRPGGGSIFWCEIAMRPEIVPTDAPQPTILAPPRAAAQGASKPACGNILLAEDNKINIELATLILEGAGYTVECAPDGVQAVQAAQMRSFDLILMDMQMPNMDGLTATRKIRALDGGRQVPIIAMTANAMKDDQRRCLEAGMDDYISKPFMPQQLLDIIAKWMNKPQPDAGRDEPGRIDSANQIPVFDENAFAELRSYVPEDRLEAMLKLFLAQIHEQTRSVTELWEQRSFPQIAQVAHQLISTAGMVGARQLQHLASRLEETCRAEKTAAAGSLVEALRAASIAASDAVRRIIENLPQRALQPA